jgi:hypothetical protein
MSVLSATTGLEPIDYRGALLSSLLQVNVSVTHNLLIVLVQIANKWDLKKMLVFIYSLFLNIKNLAIYKKICTVDNLKHVWRRSCAIDITVFDEIEFNENWNVSANLV